MEFFYIAHKKFKFLLRVKNEKLSPMRLKFSSPDINALHIDITFNNSTCGIFSHWRKVFFFYQIHLK